MTPAELQYELDVRGLNQTTAAAALRVTPAAVHYWLHGRRRIPGMVEVALIAIGPAIGPKTVPSSPLRHGANTQSCPVQSTPVPSSPLRRRKGAGKGDK
jgi:hypothetical protein